VLELLLWNLLFFIWFEINSFKLHVKMFADRMFIYWQGKCYVFAADRGRYDIKMYPTFLQLHGKTFDYKIAFTSILRLFLLPHRDSRQMFFVVRLFFCFHLLFIVQRGGGIWLLASHIWCIIVIDSRLRPLLLPFIRWQHQIVGLLWRIHWKFLIACCSMVPLWILPLLYAIWSVMWKHDAYKTGCS